MSRRWDCILFDLDGTLTDPKVGITTATAYALERFGIREDPDNLTGFIGPPLADSFREVYGFSEEQAAEAVRQYRVYYVDRGWRENVPYKGIDTFLGALKASGKKLLVATSKPEVTSIRILRHFKLDGYFDLICGPPPDDLEASRKPRVIEDALRRAGVSDRGSAVMVGDRRFDVEGAHAVGLKAVGVLYGYGSREELTASGADRLAANVEELYNILTEEGD